MRQSVTQEFDYGCGIACFAFALGISYKQATVLLGEAQARSNRFWVKDLVQALNGNGLRYERYYVKEHIKSRLDEEGTIVLIRRSKIYPAGHYLVRHQGLWMDPWINLTKDRNIQNAKSGFRKRLPGEAMYALLPILRYYGVEDGPSRSRFNSKHYSKSPFTHDRGLFGGVSKSKSA